MPLPFDATLKDMVARHLADFAELLHLPGPPPAGVLNVDLSTVSAATDLAVGTGYATPRTYEPSHTPNGPYVGM